jgi:hypothetical protein
MIVSGLNDCSDDCVGSERFIKIAAWNILAQGLWRVIGTSLEAKKPLGLVLICKPQNAVERFRTDCRFKLRVRQVRGRFGVQLTGSRTDSIAVDRFKADLNAMDCSGAVSECS